MQMAAQTGQVSRASSHTQRAHDGCSLAACQGALTSSGYYLLSKTGRHMLVVDPLRSAGPSQGLPVGFSFCAALTHQTVLRQPHCLDCAAHVSALGVWIRPQGGSLSKPCCTQGLQ